MLMVDFRRWLLFSLVIVVAGLWVPPRADASSVIPPRDIGELAQRSEAVVLVRAGEQDAVARGRMILTHTTFEVLDVVRGPLHIGEVVQVETHGGTLDGLGWAVAGSPAFEAGRTYLLFLQRSKAGTWQPRLLSYGVLQEMQGTDGSRLLTHLEETHELELVVRLDGEATEPLDTYYAGPLLAQLKRVVAGTAAWEREAVVASTRLLPPEAHAAHKQTGLPDPCVNLTSPRPTRWNTPGSGALITIYAEATGDNDFGGGPAAVQTGLAQWAGIDGVTLNWTYGGTRAYDAGGCAGGGAINGLPGDFNLNEGIVQFNDPCDEIEDLVGGTGTLAFGGPYFDNTPGGLHTHREMTWNTALLGFVVVNNGVAPVIGASGYQSMMTHELGHVLGFGHIAVGDGVANMNPSCCNDLTIIDQECALFAYSEEEGGGGGGGTAPSTIVLTTPADGATDVPTTTTFAWNADPLATSYDFQISTNGSFTNLVLNENNIAFTSAQVGTFNENTTYFWRVRGQNGIGNGPWSDARSFTTVGGAPGAVALNSPAHGALLAADAVSFQWAAVPGASGYDLQVSTSASFNSLVGEANGVTQTTRQLGPFDPDETYYWRVRAFNASGNGPWSGARSFATLPALTSSIVLTSPSDGAVDQPLEIALQWEPHPDAESYQVQVSTTANFNTLVANTTEVTATSQQIGALAQEQTYYWRVRGANAAGNGAWSDVWSFATLAATPSVPTLAQPANGASFASDASVTFRWNAAANVTSYELQIARDAAFTDLVTSEDEITGTQQSLGPFDPNATYHWRVRGRNGENEGPWSATRAFSTMPAAPAAIVLVAPADNADDQSGIVSFAWEDAADAATYQLQVSANATFTALLYDQAGLTTTEHEVGPIAYSTTYYWRVRGANQSGDGAWSETRSFITGVGTDIERVGDAVPTEFSLHAAYPNPFNPQTTLGFDLAGAAHATLRVYDLQGRLVATLVDDALPPGQFTYTWEAHNLPSGAYLVRLQADGFVQTQQVVLVK